MKKLALFLLMYGCISGATLDNGSLRIVGRQDQSAEGAPMTFIYSVTLIADGDGTAVLNYVFSFEGFYLINRPPGHLDTNTYINGTYIPVDSMDNVYRTSAAGTVEFTLGEPFEVSTFVDINRGFFTYDLLLFAQTRDMAPIPLQVSKVPEPGTVLLFGLGIAGIFAMSIRQRKAELRAVARFRLDPDAAVVPLDDAFADRQAHSGTR